VGGEGDGGEAEEGEGDEGEVGAGEVVAQGAEGRKEGATDAAVGFAFVEVEVA
jgi:hypothetical protein